MSRLERVISLIAPGWAYRRYRMRQALEELEQPRRAPLPRMADYLDPRSQIHSARSAADQGGRDSL
jgi:hypothetical protein